MTRRLLALPVLLSAFAGCKNDDTNFWLHRNELLTTAGCERTTLALDGSCNRTSFALEDRVAFIEKTSATAFILDPADPALRPRMEKVGKAPVLAVKRNGSNKLLVLTWGERGSANTPAIPAELDLIDASPQIPIERHELAGRFDAIEQSSDDRFVVLYHSSTAQTKDDSALYNPNELLLFDFLPAPAAPTKTGKSIRSMGGVPDAILFSPPYVIRGMARTLAVVLSQNYITILDLDHSDRNEISVPLCPQSTGCNLKPEQILFDPANQNLYVRAQNAKDIFQIALSPLTDLEINSRSPQSNDFHASLSMLAVGSIPADMALYGTGAATRIAVAAPQTKSLVIIEPKTGHSTSVGTAIPINMIIPFGPTAAAPLVKPQALLVDTVLGSTSVLFADLEAVEASGGLYIKDYPLATAAKNAHALVDQGIVLLVAGSLSGSNALTVVDLATGWPKQIGARSLLKDPVIETRSKSRLWSIDAEHATVLAYLNLVPRDGEPVDTGEIWLDQNIQSIVPLTTARYLVVEHNDPKGVGNVTFLDADKPDRATARTAYGFLLTDYLEREQP